MKRLLSVILLLCTLCAVKAQSAYIPTVESLKYRVMFKWGLISKQAGTVTITTDNFADGYFNSTLIGRSANWADKFYSVRDTLMGTIMQNNLQPVYYEKIARESGDFKRDIIMYDRTTPDVVGNCQRWRQKKKSDEVTYSTNLLKANGITLDMLSSFYYMRHVDYPKMSPGQSIVMNIFSGTKKETLRITYKGNKSIEIDGKNYPSYYISFTFTSGNGKKSSDDMFAWISTDSNRIPLLMMGNLPIGSIRCYYVP